MNLIQTPDGMDLYYLGPPLSQGPLPAFIYFALAGDESLQLAPYNTPVLHLQSSPIRLFSMTLPGHGVGFDKRVAIEYWIDQMKAGNGLLEPFFACAAQAILWLIHQKIISPHALVLGGLSRGAFVATHVAARLPQVSALLGFAPMTHLSTRDTALLKPLDLPSIIPQLNHVQAIRFYIGNRDTLVGTSLCFAFIKALVEHAHEMRLTQPTELRMTPSIGYQGHGTSAQTFAEGSEWVKNII